MAGAAVTAIRFVKRAAAAAVVSGWILALIAWGRSRAGQDVIEWPMGGRLVHVHVQHRHVMLAIVSGWPLREGTLWQRRKAGESWSGIPVQLTSTRPGWAGQLTSEPVLPGIVCQNGSGIVDGVGSVHLDETRSGRLPRVPATVRALLIDWPWIIGSTGVATSIVLLRVLRRLRRNRIARRRRSLGLCGICGYDLRGGGTICPECGGAVSTEDAEREVPGCQKVAKAVN